MYSNGVNDIELLNLTAEEYLLFESWEFNVDYRYTLAAKGKQEWYGQLQCVPEMAKYLKNHNCLDDADMRLAHACYEIHENNKKRIMIEAYILAGATNEHILKQYPNAEGANVFGWYCKLFFNIEDYGRLDNILFAKIIGPLQNKYMDKPTELTTLELLVKKLAMRRDADVIDDFIDVLNNKPISRELKAALTAIAEGSTIIADIITKLELTGKPTKLAKAHLGIARASKAMAKQRKKHPKVSKVLQRLFDGLC